MPKKQKIPASPTGRQMPTSFSDEPKGLVVAYIGAGKGKTTAAMGLAVRASGAGMNVCILQFVKAMKSSDARYRSDFAKASTVAKAMADKSSDEQSNKDRIARGEWPVSSEIDFFDNVSYPSSVGKIETEQVGLGFVGILGDKKQREIHMRQALQGVERARELITSGEYELIILDEIISALELKLIEERDILDLIGIKPEDVHIAMTGHNKFPAIMKVCDLVTEMKMIKHPYYKGILAQRGIDY